MPLHAHFADAIKSLPLVAILRGLTPREAPDIGLALIQSGWRLIEVPLNSPRPLDSIAALAVQCPQALVGAGTVLSPAQVHEVKAAGGQLIVSPNFDAAVVREAIELGLLCLPGVMTPSEAFGALAAGATGLKLFPGEMITPAAVKALRAVLPPRTLLLPVGGITVENLAAYRAAGADGFGIGSALYKPGMDAKLLKENAMGFAASYRGGMRT